jgi:hypothetical protein
VRALLAHRDARFYLAGQARKSPESGTMPPASDGQSRVPVGNIG